MEIPAHDLEAQYKSMKNSIDDAIQNVVDKTDFILGESVESFEENFANYCAVEHCIGTSSGTASLRLILEAMEFEPGDEVITTPFTFIGTVDPISHTDAKPVFADIDPQTYTLDPEKVKSQISDNTEAILAVHLYGQPDHMDALQELADVHDLWLIEDAAQAHGATWNGNRVGSIGDVAAFSFYPGKNLGAYGDAGGVTTSNSSLANTIRSLRDHGRDQKYKHSDIGFNFRMDGFQGAVLDVKLEHLDDWSETRNQNAREYDEFLPQLNLTPPEVAEDATHVFHQYIIRVPDRNQMKDSMNEKGIGVSVPYPLPLHMQPCFEYLDYKRGDFPEAEKAAQEVMSLPVHSFLNADQKTFIMESLENEITVRDQK